MRRRKTLYIHKPTSKLTVGSLQNFLDGYIKEKGGKVDYIHGAEVIRELSAKENSIGFMLLTWARKSFSLQLSLTAHCQEKRSPWVMPRIRDFMLRQGNIEIEK